MGPRRRAMVLAGLCCCLLVAGGSAASVASPDAAPAVAVGDAVAIYGLVSSEGKPHNGSRGVVSQPLVSGRYTVQLDGGGLLKVKPGNLRAAPLAPAGTGSSLGAEDASVALLLPDTTSHTTLLLQPEGVRWLEALRGPVVLVSVVGAYRTGKSFLLNELMGVGCSQGFTVGHRRETQTKGVWLSTRTRPGVAPNGRNVTVVYVDTEGFEGTGQASVYDDRIFAFATLVSSVLVYNLVETVKEADISRLAFSAQLSQEFLRRAARRAAPAADAPPLDPPPAASTALEEWAPPALLWLVQRDFLQGDSVDAYVRRALKPVEKPIDEAEVSLNKVRHALALFRSMQGLGLTQPHARRTELCRLSSSQLDPDYTRGLSAVRSFVDTHTEPKQAAGQPLDGSMLAGLTGRLVEALNAQKIPSAASVIDSFNSALLAQVLDTFRQQMHAIPLPTRRAELVRLHARLLAQAEAEMLAQSFGAADLAPLKQGAQEALAAAQDANFRASHARCDALWAWCASSLGAARTAWLPSANRLAARISQCNSTLAHGDSRGGGCVGPAADAARARLAEVQLRGREELAAKFSSQLLTAATLAGVGGIFFFRFVIKFFMAELLCGLFLVLMGILPRVLPTALGAEVLWETPRGRAALQAYESIIFNQLWDLNDLLPPLLLALSALVLLRWVWTCCAARRARVGRRPSDTDAASPRELVGLTQGGFPEGKYE